VSADVVENELKAGSGIPQHFQDEPFDLQDTVIMIMLQSNHKDTSSLDSQYSNARETDL